MGGWAHVDPDAHSEYFVAPNNVSLESVTDSNLLMAVAPEVYGPRFQAVAEERAQDDGTLYRGQPFRKVASLVNVPLFSALATVLDPDFMKSKRRFYKWLDDGDNWRYCTYDRRKQTLPNQLTFQDGKPIV